MIEQGELDRLIADIEQRRERGILSMLLAPPAPPLLFRWPPAEFKPCYEPGEAAALRHRDTGRREVVDWPLPGEVLRQAIHGMRCSDVVVVEARA